MKNKKGKERAPSSKNLKFTLTALFLTILSGTFLGYQISCKNKFCLRKEITKKNYPLKIKISKLKIEADIERVGNSTNGKMEPPKNINNVAWYENGSLPGEKGSAVIAGHFDSQTGPAIFYHLAELERGDTVEIVTDNFKILKFTVIEKEIYEFDNVPLEKIFNQNDKPRLNLITCGGKFDKETKNYSKRLVVYTELETKIK